MSQKPSFDLFIFDFDGTLADSRRSISNSFNFALRSFDLAVVDESLIHPMIGKLMLDGMFRNFYPQLSAEEMPLLLQSFRQYQRENVEELSFFPMVISTLEQLKAKGKSLAILSNKNIHQLEHSLEAFRIGDLFGAVYGSGIIAENKPDKASVEYIWNSLPIPAERTVMIGDSEVDVLTAQNAGIQMIAVGHGTDSHTYLCEKGANYSIESFADLLGFV